MISLDHPYRHYRRYGQKHVSLYLVSVMLLFWSIVEGMTSFASPIIITQAGLSKTFMGVILGTASIAGAGFDFILSKYLKNTHFRRVFMLMFIVTAIQPLILWKANTIMLFVLAMSLWGLYYDLMSFATFDFVSRKMQEEEHCSSFGVISVFRSVGYLIAPIIAGMVIGQYADWHFFALMWVFLGIAFIYYVIIFFSSKKERQEYIKEEVHRPLKFLTEVYLWKTIGKTIFPVLLFSTLLFTIDNFFWTIGPLIAESETLIRPFGGTLLSLYTIPTLFVGWFVGSITKKWGKKRSGLLALLSGSLILDLLGLTQNPWLLMIIIFISSTLFSFSWPAMKGVYADYISESPKFEKEISALEDFAGNIGYIIGPITAGLAADLLGNFRAFSALGIFCTFVALVLLKITPREITIKVKESEIKDGYLNIKPTSSVIK